MTSNFSKTPSFKKQKPTSIIEAVSARLIVFPNPDELYISGSCFRVAKNLYVTAKHVIEDYLHRFRTTNGEISFEIWAVHIKPGAEYSIWVVDRAWMSPISDMTVLHTKPYNDVAANEVDILSAGMELRPPCVGERVVGFGHHSPTGQITYSKDGTRHIEVNAFGAATVGEVREVHHEKRDSVRLTFPCYQVNARFDGSMSGGPVFSDRGRVCGVICSNLPPVEEDDEHISYAATLWPLMGTMINVGVKGNVVDSPYPLIDLARKGIISADGWNHVSVQGSYEEANLTVQIKKY